VFRSTRTRELLMVFYADLHIHSKYSRATSRDCDLEHLAWWAARKGVSVVGTGDFTHPVWFEELKTKLVSAEPGLFRLQPELERAVTGTLPKTCQAEPARFLLSVEISTIYKFGDRTRKIHHLIYAPDFDTADRFRRALGKLGNLASDGRPILGLDSRHLLEITLESGPGAYLVPAHIWTPWFAVLGSKSGFDAVDECYRDLAPHVFAVETGLSSDPPMNWRVSSLDRFRLISNSDAHSPPMIGREASAFETELDYFAMRRALETGTGYAGSIEFFPEEGKYHLDGHRKCSVRLEPTQTRDLDGRCPVCSGPLTVGVMHRVDRLADRSAGQARPNADPFRCLLALPQVLGEILGVGSKSTAVERELSGLVAELGPELDILQRTPLEDIRRGRSSLIAEAIDRIRQGRVSCEAGYDGEYGTIRVFEPHELDGKKSVGLLFAEPSASNAREAEKKQLVPNPVSPPESAAPAPIAAVQPVRRGPLDGLDPEQRAAVECNLGPLIIVAGPGTGKTRTLTHRFAHLVESCGVRPEQCLALTFTRRAANEMRERLAGLLPNGADALTVTTFHGFGHAFVNDERSSLGLQRGFRIADETERGDLVRSLFGKSAANARRFLDALSRARRASQALDPEQAQYIEALHDSNRLDFDDLIALPLELLESDCDKRDAFRERFRWIAVDEYQDVDALQYRLLRALAPADGNLAAIGDPDQAIYGFRGADVGYFLRLREDFPTARVIQLTRNYRSSRAIVDAALDAILPETLVRERRLEAMHPQSGPEQIVLHRAPTDRAEAEFVVHAIEQLIGGYSNFSINSGRATGHAPAQYGFGDFAVLYRSASQTRALREALERSGIPFQKRSHERLIERPDVQRLLGRLLALEVQRGCDVRECVSSAARDEQRSDPAYDASLVLDLVAPCIDRQPQDLHAFLAELTLGAEVDSWDPRADRVSLLTLHAAKGLEFPVVFLVGVEEGLLPLYWPGQAASCDFKEERRLLFVGMTRAKSRLFISHAERRTLHGKLSDTEPSRFLRDIDRTLLELRQPEARRTPLDDKKKKEQLTLF
jgi:DNA helicase II / ATP-dependent DNA helicase PcrA